MKENRVEPKFLREGENLIEVLSNSARQARALMAYARHHSGLPGQEKTTNQFKTIRIVF